MNVLVIPDIHLKPWMFERAEEIMKKGMAETGGMFDGRSGRLESGV